MTNFLRFSRAGLTAALIAIVPALPACGQESVDVLGAADLLERFKSSNFQIAQEARQAIRGIARSDARGPRADTLVAGLSRLADDPESSAWHAHAIGVLVEFAASGRPGMEATLIRLADVSEPSRMMLLNMVDRLEASPAVVNFLVRTAVSESRLAPDALYALARTGEKGQAALRRLHADGSVSSPVARSELVRMAKRDFKPDRPPERP